MEKEPLEPFPVGRMQPQREYKPRGREKYLPLGRKALEALVVESPDGSEPCSKL
jgi:hypothetical protein